MKIPLSSPAPSPDAPASSQSRSRLAKIVGRIIAVFFSAGALVFLWYMIEDWRGSKAWTEYANLCITRGWRFDWEYYTPPPVPDEENFAKTPSLAPLFEFDLGSQFWRDTNAALRVVRLEERIKDLARSKGLALAKIKTPRFDTGRRTDLTGILAASATNSLPGSNSPATIREASARALLNVIDESSKPIFDELKTACQKSKARFDLKYRVTPLASIFLPHLPVVQQLALQLSWRAYARLELNEPAEAFDDALLIFYLGDSLQGEPLLMSHHTRLACRAMAAQVIHEGIASHKWNESQLKQLQDGLSKDDFASDSFRCMLAEKAYCLRCIDQLSGRSLSIDALPGSEKIKNIGFWLSVMPDGWFYYETINIGVQYDKILAAMEDWFHGKKDIQSTITDTSVWPGDPGTAESQEPFSMAQALKSHTVLLRLMGPAVTRSFAKSLQAQVRSQQIVGACALERYRLAKGEYPDTFELLTPNYLEKPLKDPFSNAPLRYRRTAADAYVLYSVGANSRDDGAKVELDANGSVQTDKGDIVWQIGRSEIAKPQP